MVLWSIYCIRYIKHTICLKFLIKHACGTGVVLLFPQVIHQAVSAVNRQAATTSHTIHVRMTHGNINCLEILQLELN